MKKRDMISSDQKEIIDSLKIILPHLGDIRDFEKCQAHVVNEGKAVLVTVPSLPHYFLNNFDLFYEKDPCEQLETNHEVMATEILDDPSRTVKNVLLKLPPGMVVTNDFSSTAAITDGEKSRLYLRVLDCPSEIGKEKKQELVQKFFPCFWLFRIIDEKRRWLKKGSEEEEIDILGEALKGISF